MARFSDETINQIKQQSNLLALVERQGHTPKKHGARDYVISCPFHQDNTPSCVITPSENLFHCFGCGEAGSVIDWVMKTQGVSFRHAVEILQQQNPALAATGKVVKKTTAQKLDVFLAADSDDQQLLQRVVAYYHKCLLDSPEALAYLQKRGLHCPELITTFKLGYANRTLGYRLPQKNRAEGKAIRGRLQAIGLLRASGHEHFTGSLVVPVLDEQGTVQEMYGRKILGKRLRKGTPLHTYLPGAHQGIWNADALQACDEVILCESLIDAMTFWVNGVKNVTASYGTNGFTEDHLAALKHYKIKRVLIAYDNDKAGNTATEKLTEKLVAEGIDCFRIQLPPGMDVNEYACQIAEDSRHRAQGLGRLIRQAVWLGRGASRDEHCSARPERLATEGEAGTQPQGSVTPGMVDSRHITTCAENEPPELVGIDAVDGALVNTDTGEVLATSSLAASETVSATVVPPSAEPLTFTEQGHDLLLALDNLTWRIRGLEKTPTPNS